LYHAPSRQAWPRHRRGEQILRHVDCAAIAGVDRQSGRPSRSQESGCAAMKTSEAFCFHDGSLTVKTTGYGEADGSGYIAFNDEALDYEPHEEDSGTTRFQNVSKDDLVALRDFLNRVFPAPAGANPSCPQIEPRIQAFDRTLAHPDAKTLIARAARIAREGCLVPPD